MKSGFPKRIWTHKYASDHSEALELHENGVVFWRAQFGATECAFFVDEDFIKEKFAETGRTFDASKIPNFIPNPRNG